MTVTLDLYEKCVDVEDKNLNENVACVFHILPIIVIPILISLSYTNTSPRYVGGLNAIYQIKALVKMTSRSKRLVNAAMTVCQVEKRRFIPPAKKEDFTDSIKLNNAVFNQIMSNKNPILDNNDINNENLIDSLTDYSRDTVDRLPLNEKNKNNIVINDTDSIDHIILNTPSCSRVLVFDFTNNTSNKNEVLLECSETTQVSKSPTPEQLDLQYVFLDSVKMYFQFFTQFVYYLLYNTVLIQKK
ncbi:hypothetical protein AGLY_006882 [Aphis glycines]|uniref:Uncharacterized protein n=1 Tax=Aphis glycines TaxID=307491 RepID=A0A6G0TQG6_APHGL|nr:hypothetical protein AGLY_006882 [Aphis glycines]